jgi:hypothetical protein
MDREFKIKHLNDHVEFKLSNKKSENSKPPPIPSIS